MLIDAAFWLLHHFFDGHVREVLRVEHEAVVLVELGEAQPRLVVAVGDSGSSSSRDDALRAKARILQTFIANVRRLVTASPDQCSSVRHSCCFANY